MLTRVCHRRVVRGAAGGCAGGFVVSAALSGSDKGGARHFDVEQEGGGGEPEDEMQSFVPKEGENLNEELDKIVEEKIVDKEKDEELKMNINDIFKSVLEEESDEFRAN